MRTGGTRRDFLKAVGVAGGAGVLYETMGALGLAPTPAQAAVTDFAAPTAADFTLTGRSAKKVVILGAGIAGLATAYELGKAGYRCQILEAKDRPGGRNWTVRGGTELRDLDGQYQKARFSEGQYMNAGPGRVAQSMVTLDYCRELGVALETFVNQNADAYIFNENAGPMSGRPTRWRTAKTDVYGYVSELLSKATDRGALDAELSADDKERLLAFLRSFGAIGNKSQGFAYTGSDRRGYSVEPGAADEAGTVLGPAPSMTEVLASAYGQRFSFELGYDQAMMMLQPVGGMDRIAYALAKAVGTPRISYNSEVRRITDLPDGVEVTYRDAHGRERVERADFCVAALPPHVLAKIPHNLGTAVTSALAYPVPNSVGKIGLEYKSRWWEERDRIYGGITPTDMDLDNIWYPSYGFHGKRGTVIGYYNTGAHAQVYSQLSPAERTARAVAQGVKIHGDVYRTELATSFSVAWHRTPYIEGGWVSWPSRTSGEYDLLNRPAGRVYFAGDWLSYFIAWQAGAFDSARKVVTDLHQRVMTS
ncbi:flavin monoamine oxidase family protein [Actinopolymorpha pittospori]|uniref:Monoamine oxidase n=1 Tax=Actinopolymorpha pittospori TaxID=648752 RepID=A0A927R9D6_9ACTN|nr:flavin monoamine oxidase family protein [Actinopolymorpha pittospori]MBE1606379.1 monoamine oxidase [Actinopolymorpha pittospori]